MKIEKTEGEILFDKLASEARAARVGTEVEVQVIHFSTAGREMPNWLKDKYTYGD